MKNREFSQFYKGRKVLITGHNGFKGSWMCRILEIMGADVTGFALDPPTVPSLFDCCTWPDRFRFYHGDVRDTSSMRKIFEEQRPEIVIHMAAQPLVRESYRNPAETFDVNIMGTVSMLECVRSAGSVRSVVNVTTDKVYRNREQGRFFLETDELGGDDPYAASKACSELVTRAYDQSFLREKGVAVSTVRAGNVIGGGDFAADRILPDCFRAASAGRPVVLRHPEAVRPFEHVLEPLYAYLRIAAEQYVQPSLSGNYNIGPEPDGCCTVGELTGCFRESWYKWTGKEFLWRAEPDNGPKEAGVLMLDCGKLKKVFGIGPVWTVRQAVDAAAEWYAAYENGNDPEKCMVRQIEEYYEKRKWNENNGSFTEGTMGES